VVLDVVQSIHKELLRIVKYSLLNIVSEIKYSSNDSDCIQPAIFLANVDAKSLSIFLKKMFPFQPFRDRSKKRKIIFTSEAS